MAYGGHGGNPHIPNVGTEWRCGYLHFPDTPSTKIEILVSPVRQEAGCDLSQSDHSEKNTPCNF